MSVRPLKVTFNLDGTGFYYDPAEPLHLDALAAWLLAPLHSKESGLGREDTPVFVPLPFTMWRHGNARGWRASAVIPADTNIYMESLIFWRKKFRQSRIEMTQGSPNLTNGIYREYNTPLPLTVCTQAYAYCVGDRGRVRQLLKRLKWLGKKSSMGRGQITSVEVEHCSQDWSCVKDGLAMRWLPKESATRLVRTLPPYWNNIDRTPCCEVGEDYADTLL
jgi:hypothetical protein